MSPSTDETTEKTCTVLFECAEKSTPFEKRVIKFQHGTVVLIGRTTRSLSAVAEQETLLFDTRILSRKHARMTFQHGKLYLQDLDSGHGTYINGRNIRVDGEANSKLLVHEVKTGDVVRFASSRKVCSSGESHAPIVGRLTVTLHSNPKELIDGAAKEPEIVTHHENTPPFEARQLEKNEHQQQQQDQQHQSELQQQQERQRGHLQHPQQKPEGQHLNHQPEEQQEEHLQHQQQQYKHQQEQHQQHARDSLSPKRRMMSGKANWSLLQPAATYQRGTLTDSIETSNTGSQTDVKETTETLNTDYRDQWQETRRQFSSLLHQMLIKIAICLVLTFFYMMLANSRGAALNGMFNRRYKY